MRRTALLLVVLSFAMQGCTYLGNRYRDMGDVADLGFTLSARPQFAIYACAFGLAGAGYGHVDGSVLGTCTMEGGRYFAQVKIWNNLLIVAADPFSFPNPVNVGTDN